MGKLLRGSSRNGYYVAKIKERPRARAHVKSAAGNGECFEPCSTRSLVIVTFSFGVRMARHRRRIRMPANPAASRRQIIYLQRSKLRTRIVCKIQSVSEKGGWKIHEIHFDQIDCKLVKEHARKFCIYSVQNSASNNH